MNKLRFFSSVKKKLIPKQEIYKCNICYNPVELDAEDTAVILEDCCHFTHKICLLNYINSEIKTHNVPLRCVFGEKKKKDKGCDYKISNEYVIQFLN